MHLILFNTGYALSAILGLVLGTIFLIRGPKKIANRLYFINNICLVIFCSSYLLAVNTVDPIMSRNYLMFTLVNLYTVCVTMHLAFVTFGKAKEYKKWIIAAYVSSSVLLLFFLTDISRYLLPSRPLLFFPNTYNLGSYFWLFTAYFFLLSASFFFFLWRIYGTSDQKTRNRIRYFALSFGWGYGVGSIGFLTIFNINIFDPVIPSLLGLYTIPLAYGALKYDLVELGVVAKNAMIYAVSTATVGLLIIGVNVINNLFVEMYPKYPFWLVPLISGLVVVAVCFYIWRQIREADILKYEFINNISHKFRTPLTHIRWIAEELRTQNDQVERNRSVEQIQYAGMRLYELTNIVINVARDNNESYQYQYCDIGLDEVFNDVYKSHQEQAARKKQIVTLDIDADLPPVHIDRTRMQFAIQILLENALIYTPEGGSINISIKKKGKEVIFSVKDSGIGIAPEEIEHLFVKFYRTANARHTDTEGMGIGLYMTRTIVEKHGGRVWAFSEGENKGSTFSVALPVKI